MTRRRRKVENTEKNKVVRLLSVWLFRVSKAAAQDGRDCEQVADCESGSIDLFYLGFVLFTALGVCLQEENARTALTMFADLARSDPLFFRPVVGPFCEVREEKSDHFLFLKIVFSSFAAVLEDCGDSNTGRQHSPGGHRVPGDAVRDQAGHDEKRCLATF